MNELFQSLAGLGIDMEGERHARHGPPYQTFLFNINNYLYDVLVMPQKIRGHLSG